MPRQEFTKVTLDRTTYDKLTILAQRHNATRSRYLRELLDRELHPPIISQANQTPKTDVGREAYVMACSMVGTPLMPEKRFEAIKEYIPQLEMFDMAEALGKVKGQLQKEMTEYEAKQKRSLIPFFKGAE